MQFERLNTKFSNSKYFQVQDCKLLNCNTISYSSNLVNAVSADQSTAAVMVDQHMLVVIIALSTQAQAPTGVQVHRPERSGVGFASNEWLWPLSIIESLLASLSLNNEAPLLLAHFGGV